MTHMLVHHRVKDYDAWKKEFDQHAELRKQSGERSHELFCSDDDTNEVTILMEFDTDDHARTFAESDDLRQVMERAGVVGKPDISYLDHVEHFAS
ncbi:antibiotic biosynthesis monooxygenase [Haladaptatus sp. DJG-WS-42]|uniref:antibiotic biosynthesis monooxygenase n=1 Tax=Haladaptatus sp. DJG-WS-42 TaxID=3120516 RepID=UPI0030CCE4D9